MVGRHLTPNVLVWTPCEGHRTLTPSQERGVFSKKPDFIDEDVLSGPGLTTKRVKTVSYVARSVMVAEHQTSQVLAQAVHGLMQGTSTMSRYQYLANLTEIAIEIAQARKVSADEIFKTLASLPRDKVQEHIQRMMV